MCSNSNHRGSSELKLVIQIKAPILKVPFRLARDTESGSVTPTEFPRAAQVAFSVLVHLDMHRKVHSFTQIPKELSLPKPSHSHLFLVSPCVGGNFSPFHHTDLVFGPLTKQGGVEGQRDWGRKGLLGVFSAQIIGCQTQWRR